MDSPKTDLNRNWRSKNGNNIDGRCHTQNYLPLKNAFLPPSPNLTGLNAIFSSNMTDTPQCLIAIARQVHYLNKHIKITPQTFVQAK